MRLVKKNKISQVRSVISCINFEGEAGYDSAQRIKFNQSVLADRILILELSGSIVLGKSEHAALTPAACRRLARCPKAHQAARSGTRMQDV